MAWINSNPLRMMLLLCGLLLTPFVYAVDNITVQGLFKDTAVLSIDGQRRILKRGQTSPEGVKLIKADSRSAILEINGKQVSYALGSTVHTRFKAAEKTVERIWPDERGMYTVIGSINGMPVRFLVDTGASVIAMNSTEARRLGVEFRYSGKRGRVSTASSVVPAFFVRLKSVRVGGIVLKNVSATVIDGPQPDQVLLGMSFLGKLKMEHDGSVLKLMQTQ
ncbi:MAG TPA: TIGR02281 family clan AA aspartic protease [Gammaproteobacteria bacterium]|nr:TIGR02281 family clan AA aspartic protease [Gammaproteobacteria bacterium]